MKPSSSQTRAEQRAAGFFFKGGLGSRPKAAAHREEQGQEVETVHGEEVITLHSSAGVPRNISLNLQQSVWSSAKAKKNSPYLLFFNISTQTLTATVQLIKKGGIHR